LKILDLPQALAQTPVSSYQDLLNRDPHGIPFPLQHRDVRDIGVGPIKAGRYTDATFFRKEVEKVWLKTWQYACREEEIPNPGDTYIYELLDKSLLVTRQPDGSVKALRNVCRHRGRRIATQGGCKEHFRCPYHGLTWNTDGTFKHNPFAWDFPQVDPNDFSLANVRVESWFGFIFVNFDAHAAPLASLVGDLSRHMEYWRLQDCYKAAHVAKVAPANWKVVAEAFLEGHHLAATHPQAASFIASEQSQYDFITDHVTRFVSITGVAGEFAGASKPSEDRLVKAMLSAGSRSTVPGTVIDDVKLAPGQSARAYMAEMGRQTLKAETGYDFSEACDADMMDGISHDIFPAFHPWGGFQQKICYRFRPLGTDHEKTLFEVMTFKIAPKDKPKPAPAPTRLLSEDEPWTAATEIGYLAGLFDQDQANMGPTQQGLRDLGEDGELTFSRYHDLRCRNLHRMVDEYMNK
jgi:phenylpropionate dioxygenase-like ring-hydroxylating dioxygenase large terminal subunit